MVTLATSYSELGRHQNALAMREQALEIQRRVLHKDHPNIGVICLQRYIFLT